MNDDPPRIKISQPDEDHLQQITQFNLQCKKFGTMHTERSISSTLRYDLGDGASQSGHISGRREATGLSARCAGGQRKWQWQ